MRHASVTAVMALITSCTTPLGLLRDEEASIQTRALEYTLSPRRGGLEL